jgi:hypothetical protein
MLKATLCLALSALFLASGTGVGQEKTAFGDTELYEAVLNQLFAHEDYRPEGGSEELRYAYCKSGEMLIVFRDPGDTQLLLDVWHLPSGAQLVWDQLAALKSEKPTLTVKEAAAAITMVHDSRTVEKSSELGKTLLSGTRLELSLAGDDHIFLEGSVYEVDIMSAGKDVHLILGGPAQAASSSSPIIRWMGKVRAGIVALEGSADKTGHGGSAPGG